MSMIGLCGNAACTCSPCSCGDCRCGGSRLGDLERRVMDLLWAHASRACTGRDVADALPNYAYTTIATILDRLTHKGLVRRIVDGRVIRFAATDTGATHTAMAMHQALAASGDPEAALARFVQTTTRSEAAVLRQALTDAHVAAGGISRARVPRKRSQRRS